MNKLRKALALILSLAAILCFPISASALSDEALPTIDYARTGSVDIYKYDLTSAEKDGVWNSSYVSTGVRDEAGVESMHQQFGERTTHFFLSDSHRRRWTHWRALCWRLSDRNKAALYLLTAYDSLWRRMVWKCGNDGFDFQAVHLRGIKPELYSVYQAAKAIAVGSSNITLADLASPELVTDEAFQLIINALLMAKYGDVVLNLENGAMKEGNRYGTTRRARFMD